MIARLIPHRTSDNHPRNPTEVRLNTSPDGSRHNTLIIFCAAVALIALSIIGTFEARSSPDGDSPRETKPLRLIHSHGRREKPSDTAPHDAVLIPAAITPVPTEDEAPEHDEPGLYLDEGETDLLHGREGMFNRWKERNQDLWFDMDPGLRTCTRMRYVHGFKANPEAAIDECLDWYGTPTEIDYE